MRTATNPGGSPDPRRTDTIVPARRVSRRGLARPLLAVFIGWVVFSCARAAAREVKITVLHTADVGGHVFALRHRERPEYVGGLLRCMSLVRAVRQAEDHVLLIDCGGLLHGSPESRLTEGRLPLDAAHRMGYDARVAAASDLSRGLARAAALEARSRIPLLAADVEATRSSGKLLVNHAPYVVRDVDGIRVAVAGLGSWPEGETTGAFRVAPREKAVRELLRQVRGESAQVIVLAVHTPWAGRDGHQCLVSLARRFPDFDVILGGGAGGDLRGAVVGRTRLSRAASGGRNVGRIDLVYDTDQARIIRAASDLLDAGPGVEEDGALCAALGNTLGKVREQLEAVVGHAERRVAGTSPWPGQSGMQELICRGVRDRISCDIVLLGTENQGTLAEGHVLYRDVVRAVPEIPHFAVLTLTPGQLREVLEENAAAGVGDPQFLGVHGATYRYDPARDPGTRVTELHLADGSKPHGRRRLRIACSATLIDPRRGRPALLRLAAEAESRLAVCEIDTREAVIDYLRRHSPVNVKPSRGGVLAR